MYQALDGTQWTDKPTSHNETYFPPDITDTVLEVDFGIVYVPDPMPLPPTLQEQQATAWTYIMAKRDTLKLRGGYSVMVEGVLKWFHSDTFSRTQQIGLVILGANIPTGLMWKTMDGTFVTMTPTLAQEVFGAAAQSDTAIFVAAQTHYNNMMACADPTTYDFSGGWPVTFLG